MADYKELSSMQDFEMFDGTFDSIKDNLFMRLFNKNNLPLHKKLDMVPYVKYADLVLTFSVEQRTFFDKKKGLYSYLITNEDMEKLNVTEETLREIATKNLLNKNSARVETLNQHLIRNHVFSPLTRIPDGATSMIQIEGPNIKRTSPLEGNQFGALPILNPSEEDETKNILLISNRTQTFASVNLINPEVLEKVYKEFNENFYIVPSSVHELICMKASYVTDNGNKPEKQAVEDLEDMMEQINDVIHQDEFNILSYNIYYHIHDENCTMIVT